METLNAHAQHWVKVIESLDTKIDIQINDLEFSIDTHREKTLRAIENLRASLVHRDNALQRLEKVLEPTNPEAYAGQDQILDDLKQGKVILTDPTTGAQKKILFY